MRKLMQLHGIRAKGKRRFKVTTDSNHDLPIPPHLLNREFTIDEPDRVWAGDITYIATDEGRQGQDEPVRDRVAQSFDAHDS